MYIVLGLAVIPFCRHRVGCESDLSTGLPALGSQLWAPSTGPPVEPGPAPSKTNVSMNTAETYRLLLLFKFLSNFFSDGEINSSTGISSASGLRTRDSSPIGNKKEKKIFTG